MVKKGRGQGSRLKRPEVNFQSQCSRSRFKVKKASSQDQGLSSRFKVKKARG